MRAQWVRYAPSDWALGALTGVVLRLFVVPHTHLQSLSGGVRFGVYAAIAGGIFAFVAVAFTPLAILVSLAPEGNVQRLRAHDRELRRHFLFGVIAILGCALVLVGAGAADAAAIPNDGAVWVGSIALGVTIWKVLRLIQLFGGILAATDDKKNKSELR